MIESEQRGVLAMLGDLNKGSVSGRLWFWTIDISAVLLTFTSITGPRRRAGFVVGAIGIVLTLILYVVWIPK